MTLPDLSLFKDVLGRWRTTSLFIEHKNPDYPAIFTLGEQDVAGVDGETYISAKRKYLEALDPTEHTFAQSVFGSYTLWQAICASPTLAPHVAQWRKELELHLRSRAFHKLRERAEAGDVTAAKAIATGKHPSRDSQTNRTPGRPSKTRPAPGDSHSDAYDRIFAPVAFISPTVDSSSSATITVISDDSEHEHIN